MLVVSVACFIIAFIPATGHVKSLRLVLALFGKLCITVTFNAYFSWTMELYGTDLRANAMGIGNVAVRLGGASAPWIVKVLRHVDKMLPFLVMGTLGIVGGLLMLSFPETKDVGES